jgi:murein DD-endopeptidase MepM/ murein hydrolase activator NlpD
MLRQEARQLRPLHQEQLRTGYTAGNGNYVKVKHNGTYSTIFTHVKNLVRRGQHVNQGDVIGRVGSTGWTGPHVCYLWKNGKAS